MDRGGHLAIRQVITVTVVVVTVALLSFLYCTMGSPTPLPGPVFF